MTESVEKANWMEDSAKLLLRLLLGVTTIMHGLGKITNEGAFEHIQGLVTDKGLPGFIAWGAFLGELIAPVFVLVGLFTRVGAGLIALTMIFAVWLVHPADVFAVTERGIWAIELPAYFFTVGVAVALLGGGRYAVFGGKGMLN